MRRKWTPVLVLLAFGFVCGLVFLFSAHESEIPPQLKIVEQAVELGRAIVLFKVEPSDRRKIQIERLLRVSLTGETDLNEPQEFWAPNSSGLNDFNKSLQIFKVIAPTNAPQWKLQATVRILTVNEVSPLKALPRFWRYYRSKTNNWFKSVSLSFHATMGLGANLESEVIESDVITNGVPFAVEVNRR